MNPNTTEATQHDFPYFIGIDLHSNNAVVCVKTTVKKGPALVGKVIYSKKINIIGEAGVETFFREIAPYCENTDHYVVVESTYNWYWMADGFESRRWNLMLADPCTVSQANLKHSDDYTDAEYLAERLRVGALKCAKIMGKEDRALRDLCRFRGRLIQDRAREKITIVNLYTNQLSTRVKPNKLVEEAYVAQEELKERVAKEQLKIDDNALDIDWDTILNAFDNKLIRTRIASMIRIIQAFDKEIEALDEMIQASIKESVVARSLQTIKGCGYVISTVIATELGEINRFESHKNFTSYCRLAPTAKLSNGKSKGLGNAKNGNAYLSWAFTELANMVIRFNPEAKRYYDKMFNRTHLRVKAIRSTAAKLARAVYMMLKHGEVFDVERCFGC